MRYVLLVLVFALGMTEVHAWPRNRTTTTTGPRIANASAQDVANAMAARNTYGHFGSIPAGMREGVGAGRTPQEAYASCCYANSNMTTVEVGYAQSSSGRWYCCRRYR